MIPATEPRTVREGARLLVLDGQPPGFRDSMIADLPNLLEPGDLLVVNDAATLPASLAARTSSSRSIEIRLVRYLRGADWQAVLLGEGTWRTPTELRDPPETLAVGAVLTLGGVVSAEIVNVSATSDRLVTIRFSVRGVEMWTAIYVYGKPIQYAHLSNDLSLWSVQTSYAARPWAAEMPSAGQPLSWKILFEMKRRGIGIARVTHAAGLSAVGDEDLDDSLPLPERFDIPQSTIHAVRACRGRGGRVVAVGTTVVRALEGCFATHGQLVAGEGETDLRIGSAFRRQVVDGILTGVHDPAQSHFRLLRSFVGESILRPAWRHATGAAYRCHEFGDLCLILPRRRGLN
jgi:S-adenosylmethionine:tRNA ribosyltransferase-isomerase